MKVIVAGYQKTGTKSTNNALRILGYNVYDFIEHYWFHYEQWMKIFTTGSTAIDFRQMYENVDVVIDSPSYFFWEQIHEAFPDAKIILLTRDEDQWMESWKRQYAKNTTDLYRNYFIGWLSPSAWKMGRFNELNDLTLFSIPLQGRWWRIQVNEIMMRIRYRMHNHYVSTRAPKDKLLVYNVKDGWEPLCRFLGKDVPNQPFPHRNSGGVWFKEWLQDNPRVQQMHREAMISATLLLGLAVIGAYKVFRIVRSGSWCW